MIGMQTIFVALLLVQLEFAKWHTHALTCLQCREIFQPRHCHVAVECAQDEYCTVERTLNLQDEIVYNIGCRPNNLCNHRFVSSNGSINNACLECCETDLCNAQGCGQPGDTIYQDHCNNVYTKVTCYPAKRGPVCYHCGPTGDLTTCRTVQACQGHEVCFTERNTEFSDTIYTSGCRDKHLCYNRRSSRGWDGMHRKKFILSGSKEKDCCTMDLCNAKGRTMNTYTTTRSGLSTLSINLTTTSTSKPITKYTTTESRTTGILLTSCLEIMRTHPNSTSGVYKIMPGGSNESMDVYCDMDTAGGGWIVFQRRVDASVNFDRLFNAYEAGFGSLTGNLWLGLRALHILTNQKTTLRVDVMTAKNATYYATYHQFYVDGAPLYTAHCNGYSGTAGDALNSVATIDGTAFATMDRDSHDYCADMYHGGWWYNNCYGANLNGEYKNPGDKDNYLIRWYQGFLTEEGSLKFVEMKLR